MPKKYLPSQNDAVNKFCGEVALFCKNHDISVRKLSVMCGGSTNKFSHAIAGHFLNGSVTVAVVERMRPIIAAAFVEFLEHRGFYASDVEAELSTIFDPKDYMNMIANRTALTPEAIRFFGFTYDPFDVDRLPKADQLFTSPELDAVTQQAIDAVLFQKFIAMTGNVGSGKSLLKMRVAHELSQLDTKVQLLYPEFFDMEEVSVSGIATQILTELDQKVPRDKTLRVKRIREVLAQMHQEGIAVALVMDECHRLSDRVISSLKNFWEMNNGAFARLLGVMLFGQPSFTSSRLRDVKFKEIRQRIQIVEMPDIRDMAQDYLQHRLNLAGRDLESLFEPSAIEKICQNGQTFLALGNLANEALMEAFENEEQKVSASFKFFKKLNSGNQVLDIRQRAA